MKDDLLGMNFTLVMDRDIGETYISPGGYELANGKRFNFLRTRGKIFCGAQREVKFSVYVLDVDYVAENNSPEITKDDMRQKFTEFFVHTGEHDDPEINVVDIKDLEFVFSSESFYATQEQLESIRKSWKVDSNG